MNINFTFILVVMLFVILMSIQLTLNKIYVILKEMKELIKLNKNK